jgi:hypothetical protein
MLQMLGNSADVSVGAKIFTPTSEKNREIQPMTAVSSGFSAVDIG